MYPKNRLALAFTEHYVIKFSNNNFNLNLWMYADIT